MNIPTVRCKVCISGLPTTTRPPAISRGVKPTIPWVSLTISHTTSLISLSIVKVKLFVFPLLLSSYLLAQSDL